MVRREDKGPCDEQVRSLLTDRRRCNEHRVLRVSTENMVSMHLLSFLLTADPTKAEECFVCGLADCLEGSYVFRDWAQSWVRRTIILNAIRMLAPRKNHSTVAESPSDPVSCSFGRTPEAGYAIGSILGLEDFERFVFVMAVLEKYTDQDCSVLLGCARQDIAETRMRALLHVAESDAQCPMIRAGFDSKDLEETATREPQMEPQC
jgi:hypothetical protein